MKAKHKPVGQPIAKAPVAPALPAFLTRPLPVPEWAILAGLFLIALIVKFLCLRQYAAASPEFNFPVGDGETYLELARRIQYGGHWLGDTVPFQTPLYPLFMAALLAVSGSSLFFVRIVQILLGALNCVFVYGLAKRTGIGSPWVPVLAGLLTLLYGPFTFFDLELLGIGLSIFFVNASLLLLLKARSSHSLAWPALSGVCLGLAILERGNLLLWIPAAAWYLASGFSLQFRNFRQWAWKPAAVLAAGAFAMILPVTVNNYRVSHDTVLISSNAGINFYLGNNPQAPGIFRVPSGIGLTNFGLADSMRSAAEMAAGRQLKPSQVSRYWSGKAWDFILSNPSKTLALYGRKLLFFFDANEVDNHLNYAFMRSALITRLQWLFLGFAWIAPLAFVGAWAWFRRDWNEPGKLLLGFFAIYSASVLCFFVVDRYRLPAVPVLIVLAAIGLFAILQSVLAKDWHQVLLAAGIAAVGIGFVHVPDNTRHSYGHTRLFMAEAYAQRAANAPDQGAGDMQQAILQCKLALECHPDYKVAYRKLALIYEQLGCFSGELSLLNRLEEIAPEEADSLKEMRAAAAERFQKLGDAYPASRIPPTPFEQARQREEAGDRDAASLMYEDILRRDPFHVPAYRRLGKLRLDRGANQQAIALYKTAIRRNPDYTMLWEDLAQAYYQAGDMERFREAHRRSGIRSER